MSPTEFTFFSVTLFLALVALLEWKRRRDLVRQRVSKGLRGFVANQASAQEIEEEGDSLAIAQ
ncbi:MAG TPA: hypothetical protein VKE70_18335 [Candidatus Solibacter sp.]|nr:hypothetical protein [Candidatus Solibacter sp.]